MSERVWVQQKRLVEVLGPGYSVRWVMRWVWVNVVTGEWR